MSAKRKAIISQSECVACGCCIKVCPRTAIEIYKGIYAQNNPNLCVGCGKCESICPANVIGLEEVI